jgi:hypothetical protein
MFTYIKTMEREKKEISIGKQDKTRYEIFMKAKIKYGNIIEESNFHSCVVFVMRELNKSSVKYGFSKKSLCEEILVLLLQEIGCPELVVRIGLEVLSATIEQIYLQNYHRQGKCIIL